MNYVLQTYQPIISMTETDEDLEWITRFIAGDETAFTLIVNKYRRYIYSIAYRFVHNQAEADDLTQETFIKAFRNLKGFRKDSSLKTWLTRIVTNSAINVKKSGRITKDSGLVPEDVHPSVTAEGLQPLIQQERNTKLKKAIAKLPPKQKKTLILKTYQEMTCKEVAQVMTCSIGTVKANLFNAIKNLKILMGETS